MKEPLFLGVMLLAGGALAAPDGAALFAKHCAACHQADASGAVGLAPALKGEHWKRLGADRAYLPTVITHGLSGAIEVNGTRFVGSMPMFAAGQLDDEAVAAVATYLQGLQGGGADYSAAEVAAVRAVPGNPGQTRQRRQQLLGK